MRRWLALREGSPAQVLAALLRTEVGPTTFVRWIFALAVVLSPLHAGPRTSPARPAAVERETSVRAEARVPTKAFMGATYLDARAWAARYGLKPKWLEAGRRLELASSYTSIILEADRRDFQLNKLRVFLGEPVVADRDTLWISVVDALTLLGAILRPSSVDRDAPSLRVICLDPGHGGNDAGTQNKALKLDEKRFTLDVAERAKKLLEGQGYKVIMTRTSDRFVDLADRAEIANRASADLFVSIHFNAFPQGSIKGTETYILTRRAQRSTSSAKRDDSDKVGLPGNTMDSWNAVLGYAMHRQLLSKLSSFDRGLKFARFKVLTLVNCPGVLVESGYLSNDAEARKIANPEYRGDIAEAIVNGINGYAAQLAAKEKK